MAGLNVTVRHIELVGGKMDEIPRELCTAEGAIYETSKAYFVSEEAIKASGATEQEYGQLLDRDGQHYEVSIIGYVRRCLAQDA